MQEVKKPKKPLIYYYVIVMAILLLVNFLLMPWMAKKRIQEVDYGTFMDMTEEKQIGVVQIDQEENQIVFPDILGAADPDLCGNRTVYVQEADG